MEARPHRWDAIEPDNPVPHLFRKKVTAANMLVARIKLEKGCVVGLHSHVSEQVAIVERGHVRWTLGSTDGPETRELEMRGGEVLEIPAHVPHGLVALEDTEIIDVLSPVGAMGVDSQPRGH